MSRTAKRSLLGGSLLATILSLVAMLLLADPFSGAAERPVREIVLEARDLAFGGNNPTLAARPGERIRLVVKNTDPGIIHSISLPGIDPQVRSVRWGEEVVLEFTAPQSGTYDYVCPQHAPQMAGRLVVVEP